MTKVQEFLKQNGVNSIEDLGIKIKHYPERKLYVLNYDQIESPKSHPFVIECRSLILDEEFNLISRTFDRFFNYGETPEYYSDFDINRAIVMEKADGSLTKVYWEPQAKQWEIGTRSLAFAEGDHVMGGTWRDKIIQAFGLNSETEFQNTFNKFDNKLTFIFEYISPENRIVTRYEKPEMVLTGIRNEHAELSWADIQKWNETFNKEGLNTRMPHTYSLNNFDEIVKASKELPTLTEGYVVWDTHSNKRVKIKNPAYVAIHGLRDNGVLSMKRVYSLVLMNEQDEYLSYFPEDAKAFEPAIKAVANFKENMDLVWNGYEGQEPLKNITDQKEFALIATQFKFSPFLFTAKKKGTTPAHEFDESDIEKKVKFFVNNPPENKMKM